MNFSAGIVLVFGHQVHIPYAYQLLTKSITSSPVPGQRIEERFDEASCSLERGDHQVHSWTATWIIHERTGCLRTTNGVLCSSTTRHLYFHGSKGSVGATLHGLLITTASIQIKIVSLSGCTRATRSKYCFIDAN